MFGHGIRGFWLSVAVALLTLGNAALTYGDTAIPVVKVNFQDQYEESGKKLEEKTSTPSTKVEDKVEAPKDKGKVNDVLTNRQFSELLKMLAKC